MRLGNLFLAALFFFLFSGERSFAQHYLVPAQYQLVMTEEFDYKSADDPAMKERWLYHSHDRFWSGGIEGFFPEQLELRKNEQGESILRIHANRSDVPFSYGGVPKYFKSGMVSYRLVHEPNCKIISWLKETPGFTYGIFEVRAKIPKGDPASWDAWPAIWMASPGTGEIDLVDAITNDPGKELNYALINWHRYPHEWSEWQLVESCQQKGYSSGLRYNEGDTITYGGRCFVAKHNIEPAFLGRSQGHLQADLTDDYHIYAVAWTPRQLTFFLDGKELQTIYFTETMDMYDCPMRIIVNLSVLGKPDGTPSDHSATDMYMDVDYVKVYQNKADPNAEYMVLPPYNLPMYFE